MEKIIISTNVNAIGDNIFYPCEGLEKITMSDSILSICERAFADCKALKYLILSDSLSLSNKWFDDDTNQEYIIHHRERKYTVEYIMLYY